MATGKCKHKTGKDAPNWKGGWKTKLPKCTVCGITLANRYATNCRKHAKRRDQENEKNSMWKGADVKYVSLHTWVSNRLGKPSMCENCGNTNAKRYEWANLTREYVRDLAKWTRLCSSCHIKHDRYKHKLTLEYKQNYIK